MSIALLLLFVIVPVAIIAWVIGLYNRLITLRNRVDEAWAQIDVQLKRRYDLIPNLVETVKGYASHERTTFENVTKARNMAVQAAQAGAAGAGQIAAAENMLTGTLKTLFAVAENYPQLKANENFKMLQEELSGTEGKVAYARQFFNESVLGFNNAVQLFPTNLIAGLLGFQPRAFFRTDTEAERQAPKVQF
jgi:LemA protein